MPKPHPSRPHYQAESRHPALVGLTAAILTFAFVSLLASRFGAEPGRASAYAAAAALLVGLAVYRERSLLHRLECALADREVDLARQEEKRDRFFRICETPLAIFDIDTALVSKASPGLALILQRSSERELEGAALADVLSVEPETLDSILDRLRETGEVRAVEIAAGGAAGAELKLGVSAVFVPEEGTVIACFVDLTEKARDAARLEDTLGDLERFRQGMMRREMRILELKGEVNRILRERGDRPRYTVDDRSDDSQLQQRIAGREVS